MEKKGNIIIISILSVLCILLVGYIVYDKVFSNRESTASTENNSAIENGNSSVVNDSLPEWVTYLLNQNITEITYEDGTLDDNSECNPAKNLTKEQLRLILEKMTTGKLTKYEDAGFGGLCWSGIKVKYNDKTLSMYHSSIIFVKNTDSNIVNLLEKEKYTLVPSDVPDKDTFYSYAWDTSYIDTIIK